MFSARKAALYAILSSIQTLRRCPRDMKRIFLFSALVVFAAAAAAQQYKWVDKDGKVRYGDVPPPGVKAQRLRPPPGASAPSPAPAAPAAKKDAKDKPLTPEQAFQKRQKEAQEQDAKLAKERQDADAKRANCEQAQAQLRAVQSGQRVARTNAAGEQVILDDAEMARERDKAQKLVSEWCK